MISLILDEFALALEAFHFLRPMVLLALLPVLAVWWIIRRRATRPQMPREGLAPHLRDALTVGAERRGRVLPIDTSALVIAFAILGASGPSWTRQVDPFFTQTGPLVVVLKVTPSMEQKDVAPTRLDRAKFKIRDLLDLRAGARTALVAYAGSAHRVMPFTEDPSVMLPYLEGLSPDVMPQEGADLGAALEIASSILGDEEAPGSILVVSDEMNAGEASAVSDFDTAPITVLSVLPDGQSAFSGSTPSGVQSVTLTADNADVAQIDRITAIAYRRALLEDTSQPWEDRGWWFAIPAALVALFWFRLGWTMRWTAVVLAIAAIAPPQTARADGIADWFFTPDQQGYRAYQNKDFAAAAEAFADPYWQGYALFRSGQYPEAIAVLETLDTPEAAFTLGHAYIRNRQYRDGVRAFETVLERDPDFPDAQHNLDVSKQIVTYVEETRAASDTGEETGIGADEVVFDNEANVGTDTEIDAQPEGDGAPMTADQWMNTVDTNTADFLRTRFQMDLVSAENSSSNGADGPSATEESDEASEPPAETEEAAE
ncbi:VWA domain-containing protein [Halocynthiibacter sp. C4]|uniref:VWA domain-containing protein n=1 Tax=Halocynthiibacter sp. C4 TaxID=2992758 RepID=UPI00237A6967|nr:VWA domain-containing protein [Halocynthiibacter sp. C4]MDE0589445.1 VWA domain-containing protein [Halocynthiibacter sp. C4]